MRIKLICGFLLAAGCGWAQCFVSYDPLLNTLTCTPPVTKVSGITFPSSVTSGGVLYFPSSSTAASSGALAAHGAVIGGGAGAAPVTTTAGTAGQLLTSNGASADPTFQTQNSVCDFGTWGASPTLNAASCNSVSGLYTTFTNDTTHRLGANATVAFANFVTGATYKFIVYQGAATAYTVTWPASVLGGCTIDPTLSAYTIMIGVWDGTNLFVNGNCSTSDTQFILRGPTRTAPTTPTSGFAAWVDSTNLGVQTIDTNGQIYGQPLITPYTSTGTALLAAMANPIAIPLTSSATGVTVNKLVKLDSSGNAIIAATTDTSGIVGISTATATSGTVLVVTQGIIRCEFDTVTPVKGHWVQISSGAGGKCTDAGAAEPVAGGQIIGRLVDETVTGASLPYKVAVNLSANPNPGTTSNCASAAAPAVCGSAAAGSVVIAAAGTTVTVNTTAVTANSIILLTYDSSLNTKLSVTCNTTQPPVFYVTARTAATSFVITATASVTNPGCFNYLIVD